MCFLLNSSCSMGFAHAEDRTMSFGIWLSDDHTTSSYFIVISNVMIMIIIKLKPWMSNKTWETRNVWPPMPQIQPAKITSKNNLRMLCQHEFQFNEIYFFSSIYCYFSAGNKSCSNRESVKLLWP